MLIDKDVSMKTRDGVTLRADVYRPAPPRGVFPRRRPGRLPGGLGVPLGGGFGAREADPVRDPDGARLDRAAGPHEDALAGARARARSGPPPRGPAAVARSVPAPALD